MPVFHWITGDQLLTLVKARDIMMPLDEVAGLAVKHFLHQCALEPEILDRSQTAAGQHDVPQPHGAENAGAQHNTVERLQSDELGQ